MRQNFLMNFTKWVLIIGPLLIVGYFMLVIPFNQWPIGDRYPDNESIASYLMPLLVPIILTGAILGSFLFIAKELVTSG